MNAAVLKTVDSKGSGGSNPSPSAKEITPAGRFGVHQWRTEGGVWRVDRDVDRPRYWLYMNIQHQRRHGGDCGIISSRSDETDSETD